MKRFIAPSQLAIVCTAGISNQAQAHGQSVEARQLMQATNEDRARNGLGPLKWDPALAHAAQRHAEIMAQHGALSHQYSGEADLVTRVSADGAHFREVAENLAVAPTPGAVEDEWMHSAPHRRNILDPHRPKFIMRWQGSDLSRLPNVLEEQISTGRFRTAAVGACDTGHGQPGFTTYRLAVMLF